MGLFSDFFGVREVTLLDLLELFWLSMSTKTVLDKVGSSLTKVSCLINLDELLLVVLVLLIVLRAGDAKGSPILEL